MNKPLETNWCPDPLVVQDYVNDILTEQEALNAVYDPNWVQNYDDNKFTLAAIREIVEISDELSMFSHFFGARDKYNFHLAIEEFVDVIHFYATRVLRAGKQASYAPNAPQTPTSVTNWLHTLTHQVSAKNASVVVLHNMISTACFIFDLTPDTLLVAYLHKNRKNHERAKAGAMNHDIQELKNSEMSTFDFLRSEHWFSLTAEQYNAKMAEYHSAGGDDV